MKKVLIFIVAILCYTSIFAQRSDKIGIPVYLNFFFSPIVEYSMAYPENPPILIGGGGGAMFNDRLYLGVFAVRNLPGAKGTTENAKPTIFFEEGVWIGGTFFHGYKKSRNRLILSRLKFNGWLQTGAGCIITDKGTETEGRDFFYVIKPSLEAEFLITPFLRVGAASTYQITKRITNRHGDDDYKGLNITLTLKVLLFVKPYGKAVMSEPMFF